MTNATTSTLSENPASRIKQDLVDLCDSYKRFQYYCAFYCKSSSVLVRCCNMELDEDYVEGMARFAQMVIEQSQEIDLQLKKLLRTV
ncbi:MAG: hypothetical protein V4732_06490 [Pseudomonadota bacterium]